MTDDVQRGLNERITRSDAALQTLADAAAPFATLSRLETIDNGKFGIIVSYTEVRALIAALKVASEVLS